MSRYETEQFRKELWLNIERCLVRHSCHSTFHVKQIRFSTDARTDRMSSIHITLGGWRGIDKEIVGWSWPLEAGGSVSETCDCHEDVVRLCSRTYSEYMARWCLKPSRHRKLTWRQMGFFKEELLYVAAKKLMRDHISKGSQSNAACLL